MNKNRGMFLEEILNNTILFYKKNDLGLFHKKDLPIKLFDVSANKTNKVIAKGYIYKKSTSDYYGIYQGKFIAFEAKSTRLNELPLNNIKIHQIKYLNDVLKFDGIAFLIIYFVIQNKYFAFSTEHIKKLKRKSISIDACNKYGYELFLEYPGIIDFTKYVNSFEQSK